MTDAVTPPEGATPDPAEATGATGPARPDRGGTLARVLGDREQRRREALVVLPPFLLAHVLSVGGWVMATILKRRLKGSGYVPDSYAGFLGWMSWDARYYRIIVDRGYGGFEPTGRRFFPLYSLIVKPFAKLFGHTDFWLLLSAKAALVVAVVLLYRLIIHETGDRQLATLSVWVLLLFPGAFVLTWAYSEPLFLALAIGAIFAMRTKRFGLAIVLGLLAGLCRPLGIALVPVALIEGWRGFDVAPWRARIVRLLAVGAPGVGMGAYLTYTAISYGDFFAPLTIQDEMRTNGNPISRLVELGHQMVGSEALKAGLHVPFVIGFTVLFIVVARRLPASYAGFVAVIALLTLSADNLNSLERYGMNAFPLSIGLAMLIRRDERLQWVTMSLAGATFLGLTALALSASYVP